jgi:hypothetical protein
MTTRRIGALSPAAELFASEVRSATGEFLGTPAAPRMRLVQMP